MNAARPKRFIVKLIDRRKNFAGREREVGYATRPGAIREALALAVLGDVTITDRATGQPVAFETDKARIQ